MIFKIWPKRKYALLSVIIFFASLDGILISSIFKNTIEYIQSGMKNDFYVLIIKMISIYFIVTLSNYIYNRLKNSLIKDMNIYLKNEFLKKYLMDKNYSKVKKEETSSFIFNEVKLYETNYVKVYFDIFLYLSYALTSLIYSLIIDYKLAFLFVLFSLIPSIFPFIFKKFMRERSLVWTNNSKLFTTSANEVLEGYQTIKSYEKESLFLERVKKNNEKMENSLLSLNNLQALSIFTIGFTSVICYILPVCLGGIMVIRGYSALSNLIAVFLASDRIITPLKVAFQIYNNLNSVNSISEHIKNVLNEKIETTKIKNKTFGSIVFNDVSKKFDKEVFSNINLTINPEDKILLVGESGSGKSVFLKLIKELEKPTKGSIEKISEGRLKNIRYIPQKDFMFEDTLDFNISFDQKCDNLSLLKKRVEINNNFPADIELRGENLSGGQAKRIAIARGLFCDDSLLLFDEPFQGLSEQQAKTIEKNILINRSPVIISSHQIYDQNLKYYNKFFIVKDKNIIVYNTLSEFLECDYYRKNKIDSQ